MRGGGIGGGRGEGEEGGDGRGREGEGGGIGVGGGEGERGDMRVREWGGRRGGGEGERGDMRVREWGGRRGGEGERGVRGWCEGVRRGVRRMFREGIRTMTFSLQYLGVCQHPRHQSCYGSLRRGSRCQERR